LLALSWTTLKENSHAGAGAKTGLAVCITDLKRLTYFFNIITALGPVAKIYVALFMALYMDNFRRGLHSFFITDPKMYQLYHTSFNA
jgi:hypothetical protein